MSQDGKKNADALSVRVLTIAKCMVMLQLLVTEFSLGTF